MFVTPSRESDRDRIGMHLDWLQSSQVRLPDGRVHSWTGKGQFPYDEAAGYLIKLIDYCAKLTGDASHLDSLQPCLDHLARTVQTHAGIGRQGQIYLFDTGIALAALTAHANVTGADLTVLMTPLANTIYSMISTERAVRSFGESQPDNRWSRRFGPHLIKMVIPLIEASELLDRPELKKISVELADRLVETTYREGVFYTQPDFSCSYTHGHCYAVEGLLYADALGVRDSADLLRECAEKLVSLQRGTGGVVNWYGRDEDLIETSDATAQAVRIWQCVDSGRFAAQIARGIGFLASITGPDGGFRYHQTSDNLNTWTTVFAVEAMLWKKHGPDPLWII
jgi:hypothetical protein